MPMMEPFPQNLIVITAAGLEGHTKPPHQSCEANVRVQERADR